MEEIRKELTKLMLGYKFAMNDVLAKIEILQEEFKVIHEYSPIEHVASRIKHPKSILKKVNYKNLPLTIETIQDNLKDIAGIRIVCSFEEDLYKIADMLCMQRDIQLIEKKDYIKHPKDNGYRSLHLIMKVPVFLSTEEREVYVEIQLRTIAMDFWASLEHKIYYKYNHAVPEHIKRGLKEAADQATVLDKKMANLNKEINILKDAQPPEEDELAKLISEFISSNRN